MGVDTIDDWLASKEQVVQINEAHGAVELLVDVRDQTTAPSTLDIFDFGKDWPPGIRTAILVGEETREDQRFLETVAFNRAKQMRIFDDEEKAVHWLRE